MNISVKLIIAGSALMVPLQCWAQTFSVSLITAGSPNLGKVVSAPTGSTTFRVAASGGTITIASGAGKLVSTGTSVTTVTVNCSGGQCNSANANLTIANAGSPTLRAGALTNFTVAMGSATLVSGPTGTNPLTFTIGPIGNGQSKTFFLGADFPIVGDDSGLATGVASSGFSVAIALIGGGGGGSLSSTGTAQVQRPLSLSFLPAGGLAFGRVVRPSAGAGTVSIDATTGARTVTGTNAIGVASPAPARVVYTATGEGGQAISISVPSSFLMTSGANSLTVTPTATATGAQTLSSTLGSQGTFAFGLGGSFPIASTTVSANYSGTFAVTVNYN